MPRKKTYRVKAEAEVEAKAEAEAKTKVKAETKRTAKAQTLPAAAKPIRQVMYGVTDFALMRNPEHPAYFVDHTDLIREVLCEEL